MKQMELGPLLHHLGYEWWMFRVAYKSLTSAYSPAANTDDRNRYLESLVLHGALLLRFFYKHKHIKRARREWTCRALKMQPQPTAKGGIILRWLSQSEHVLRFTSIRLDGHADWNSAHAVYQILEAKIASVVDAHEKQITSQWVGFKESFNV